MSVIASVNMNAIYYFFVSVCFALLCFALCRDDVRFCTHALAMMHENVRENCSSLLRFVGVGCWSSDCDVSRFTTTISCLKRGNFQKTCFGSHFNVYLLSFSSGHFPKCKVNVCNLSKMIFDAFVQRVYGFIRIWWNLLWLFIVFFYHPAAKVNWSRCRHSHSPKFAHT